MSNETQRRLTHSRGPFQYGDRVQLTGPKDRKHTITLVEGGSFHTQHGMIRHEELVGLSDASVVTLPSGHDYLAIRPLLRDFVIAMPRGAAIVYPKDAAQIVSLADIAPGQIVVEAGVGSGALSIHLIRALAGTGTLISVERRDEFAQIARANVEAFFTEHPQNWQLEVGDLQDRLAELSERGGVDRVVLDMLAPWECVEAVADALTPGGTLICYVATVTQLSRVAEEISRHGGFTHPESSELMQRSWHVEGLAVRPDHRMVGHTGFLITARRLAPGAVLPERKRRASKSDYDEEDLRAWTPDLVGERQKSDKVLRKKVREAQRFSHERHTGTSTDSADRLSEDTSKG